VGVPGDPAEPGRAGRPRVLAAARRLTLPHVGAVALFSVPDFGIEAAKCTLVG
jgi:hypothetical protein